MDFDDGIYLRIDMEAYEILDGKITQLGFNDSNSNLFNFIRSTYCFTIDELANDDNIYKFKSILNLLEINWYQEI